MNKRSKRDRPPPRDRVLLGDHTKRGSVFVPPFIRALEQNGSALRLRSWISLLPELVWLSFLGREHGEHIASRLVSALARECRKHVSNQLSPIFGAITHYDSLSSYEWATVCRSLRDRQSLSAVQHSLRPLVALYPQCPMAGLFEGCPQESQTEDTALVSATVLSLFDRHARSTVMAEACFTWLAFDAGLLKVPAGSALSQFPMIQDYPHTESSRKIAAAIRNTNRILFGPPHYGDEPSDWTVYFWNRGMEISGCRC